jgi:undecaprenyl-phosphate galactose phosphotransferase
MAMKYIQKSLQFLALVLIDAASYFVSLALAVFLRENIAKFFFENLPSFNFQYSYFASILWLPLVFFFTFVFFKLYQRHFSFWEETENILKAIFLAIIIIFFVISIRKLYGDFSRLTIIFLGIVSCFFFPLFRYIGKKILGKSGIWREDVLILGDETIAAEFANRLKQDFFLGFHPIALLNVGSKRQKKHNTLSSLPVYYETDIALFLRRLGTDTVFIITKTFSEKTLSHLAAQAYSSARNVIFVPLDYPVALFNAETHYLLKERRYLIYAKNNLNRWWNLAIKRTIDIVGSLFGLIVLSPLLLTVALIIKLTSPGKVIFSQERIGKNGKRFRIYKFRSMYPDAEERLKHILATDPEARAEWETKRKLSNDPRITPIGKFIRKTSIDELPQLINILKGDLSIVGPRPVSAEEIETFYKENRVYYYTVRPGLTGLWQVSGRSNTDYNYRVQTDAWYVENWSLWLDMVIILKTFEVILKREGAY